jgi:hypothetical protein
MAKYCLIAVHHTEDFDLEIVPEFDSTHQSIVG